MLSEGVVDRLEALDIEHDQREHAGAAAGCVQRLRQAVLEQGPVGQLGERIVQGEIVDFLLLGLHFQRKLEIGDHLGKQRQFT